MAVKYFTAPPVNDIKRSRQSAFFGANKILNEEKFIVFNGHYTSKEISCGADCKRIFKVSEEKRTDVSLALNIIMDCVEDNVDTIVLVTADSDQIPTIQTIKKKFPQKNLKVYFPPKRNSLDILAQIKPVVYLENHEDKFKIAIMPGIITDGKKKFTRPSDWKGQYYSKKFYRISLPREDFFSFLLAMLSSCQTAKASSKNLVNKTNF